MDDLRAHEPSNIQSNDFDQDFAIIENFEEFMDQIREDFDKPISNYASIYCDSHQQVIDNELMYFLDGAKYNNQFLSTPEYLFEYNQHGSASNISGCNIVSDPNLLPSIGSVKIDGLLEEEENDRDDYSSGNTNTPRPSSSLKRSTSTLLVDGSSSERKRRSWMKQKLYSLRALVPNITKMDKTSIIGDAVSYVQDLQMQAEKLRFEITNLESSSANKRESILNLVESPKKNQTPGHKNMHQSCKKIVKMDVFQVDESLFHVRIVCNKGEGVALFVYKALESLTSSDVQSSNFRTYPERVAFTFMVNLRECAEKTVELSNLTTCLNSALLDQGFEYKLSNV
ncbi:hypothetical protein C5167_028703 [Papaver somniferum]|uniref:transcription factor FER-LIKE IRON DEFICIENCY-INDUCED TRANSCRIPTION FACTOR-like n=1 Tax=Papaver somniferum TaxID=3469 RepID=UPI000E6FDA1D|nr:transcription factor FER-LIKE IRON DEFICIENCY-INDUCED TRANSCRIPTION FACTOR-like [Papaver somniferum]RZC90871.1 hypothetical protein C5167_028703 [Papaver somniferum]